MCAAQKFDQNHELGELQRSWCIEAEESDLGLWWLADDVRAKLPDGVSEEEVIERTVAAVRPLLEAGALTAVTLDEFGSYAEWPGTVCEILDRIQTEWRMLQRAPQIGDVVWFIGCR